MRQNWAIWLSPKVNVEIMVQLHASLLWVHIYLENVGALVNHVWVELLVPI